MKIMYEDGISNSSFMFFLVLENKETRHDAVNYFNWFLCYGGVGTNSRLKECSDNVFSFWIKKKNLDVFLNKAAIARLDFLGREINESSISKERENIFNLFEKRDGVKKNRIYQESYCVSDENLLNYVEEYENSES